MDQFGSVDELLDFAIKNEIEAAAFYKELASKMERPAMREVFEGFSKEEQGHRKKLEAIKADKSLEPAQSKVPDLKVGDYLVDVQPTADMTYQDALILAMKKEKAAYRLYNDLAVMSEDAGLRDVMLMLAQEEAKHKVRFEIEYDEYVMTEN
jgi:rubrerythrin